MSITIALAGNPNSGKTTLFNELTGANQFVGNWPGVTVEKKEGKYKDAQDVVIIDLPGIYSLSPYTPEEVVARNYLHSRQADVILNIVDGTNLERNLYLTTQLTELGIPVVAAINMMDIVAGNGDEINLLQLSKALGCAVVELSALKGTGITAAVEGAIVAAKQQIPPVSPHGFCGSVEHTLAHIEEATLHEFPEDEQRWYAIKLFERDQQVIRQLQLDQSTLAHIESDIKKCEAELDDDAESIIINERYTYISSIINGCYLRKNKERNSISDKIDRVVTNRWAALPIFALVMFVVYFVSVTTVGAWASHWVADGVFGEGWHLLGIGSGAYQGAVAALQDVGATIPVNPADYGIWVPGVSVVLGNWLQVINCAEWLQGLILDGIVGGVGAVLGFVPQMLVLFLFLAFLEACGYMVRIAFIMDRIFRKFGLSGKSFIPMLIGTGCGVPGIMASRTIENERDRRMTIMTTTFIPCGAKLPVIALIAGALFDGAWWVAPSAYFLGVAAIVISGLILKKTKLFAGQSAPFVMELPSYHLPTITNLLRSMWERGWSFIKKAGTIILLASICIWFSAGFGWQGGHFGMTGMNHSILAAMGGFIAPLFTPIGWGNWQAAVATITGLIAKENIVGTFGVLGSGFANTTESGWAMYGNMREIFTPLSGFSFLVFNLLCAPCCAAVAAIGREMHDGRWVAFAVTYQCIFAYAVSLCIYQLGILFTTGTFGVATAIAMLTLVFVLYLLARPYQEGDGVKRRSGV